MRSIILAMVLAIAASTPVRAQGSGNSPASSSPASTGPSASQGPATIENQMITYEVLRQMASQIADRVWAKCQPSNCSSVLLTDPNSQSEIITANGFEVSAKALADAYDSVEPSVARAEATPTLSDIAALLTAIKSSAVYSNQTFQPTTQSMITLLSKELHKRVIALWTSAAPEAISIRD